MCDRLCVSIQRPTNEGCCFRVRTESVKILRGQSTARKFPDFTFQNKMDPLKCFEKKKYCFAAEVVIM